MERWEQHAIQEWHVFHTRVKHGNVQISKMDLKKPLPSQRRVAWQCIYTRWRTPNGQHRNKNKNAMVTVHPTYIEKWWCMMRRRVEIWKGMFHHPQGHLQKKKVQNCFQSQKGLFYVEQRFVVTDKNGLMAIWIPKVRIIEVSPRRQTSVVFQNMPDHLYRRRGGMHAQSGSYPQASWTVLWLPPILRSQIRIAPRT